MQAGDAAPIVYGEAAERLQVADQIAGQRSVIDVGAGDHAGGGDGVGIRTALDDQRNPVAQCLLVLGVFHAAVKVVSGQGCVSLLEEGDVGGAVHEAHVRHRMDEQIRRGDRLLADQITPELAGEIELDIDLERFRDVDAAIAALRRIVEFAQRGVAGAGIVPGVGAFQRRPFQHFENLDAQRWLEFLKKNRERGTHDAGADQDDVGICGGTLVHGCSPVGGGQAAAGQSSYEAWRNGTGALAASTT